MSDRFSARQYAALVHEGLRLHFTGGRQAGEDGSRHILGASYSLTLSTLVAWILYTSATPAQFLLFMSTFSMIFFTTGVIGELATGIFHPLDLSVTGHLPVSGFTRFSARFSQILVTLGVLTLNLNLTPSILFGFMTGSHLAGPILWLAAAFGAAIFTTAVCLVFHAVLARFLSALQLEGVLLYVNIMVSLAILGLLVNTGPLLKSALLQEAGSGSWPLLYPPAWFAALALKPLGLVQGTGPGALMAIGALGLALLLLFFAALGSENLLRTLGGGQVKRKGHSAPSRLMGIFEAVFVRPSERAAFEFTAVNLSRDRGFRLMAYPILGVPVLMICLSLFEERTPGFFIIMLHLMNLYLALTLAFLCFSDHGRAGWIFQALPVAKHRIFLRGAEKAFLYRIAFPLFLLNALVLSVVWAPWPGFSNALYAFLMGLFLVGIRFRCMEDYPFSQTYRGNIKESVMEGGGLIPLFFLAILGALFQYITYRSTGIFLTQIIMMGMGVKLRHWMVARKEGVQS